MANKRLPSHGEMFTATVGNLAAAYGIDESSMHVAVYAIAEQIHRHYCLSRGLINHSESRPDQDVAVSVLSGLAGTDWWLVRNDQRVLRTTEGDAYLRATAGDKGEPFVHFGDETVLDGWAEPDDTPQG